MTRIRVFLPAALLFATGCVTVPSGIVDNFVPPQGQTVVTEVKTPLCSDEATTSTSDSQQSLRPCAAEVVTIALAPPPKFNPSTFERNRPRPPRMPGRR